jgi:ANTAR domain
MLVSYSGRCAARTAIGFDVVSRRQAPGNGNPSLAGSNLDAFRRHREEAPAVSPSALIAALNDARASDDPAITFASLARACVPEFADGCEIELSDGGAGDEPIFRAAFPPDSPGPGGLSAEIQDAGPDHIVHTRFRAPSRAGYLSYAGVLTHWWMSRPPTESDTVAADLMAKYAMALVDRERLMAALTRTDDQAAEVVLAAIAGRTINMAIGIVMRQHALSEGEAEKLLREAGSSTGSSLYETATHVVLAGAFGNPRAK